VIKLKNSNCAETQKLKLWWNSKTQIVIKLKLKWWQNSKSQIVTKLKNSNRDNTQIVRDKIRNSKCDNLNCDKTWELKLCQKLKLWQTVMKLKNSNCDDIKKTQIVIKLKLKWWQNSKTQTVTKLKISNCDKTQILKSWQKSNCEIKNSKTQNVTTQIVTKLENSNSDKHKN
jgi:hypothetical protein